MRVESFLLCDAATDHQGKLNVLGTFDRIFAAQVPVAHPACAVAARLRFDKMEEGVHHVKIEWVDPDGQPLFKPMEGDVNPRMGEDAESVAVNLILNFHGVKFDAFADYQINLLVDDVVEATLPLRVGKVPAR